MTTARATTTARKPSPRRAAVKTTEAAVELTAGERLAADLRVLADIAAKTPPASDDKEWFIALRVNGGAVDVLAAALAEQAAIEQPARVEPRYTDHEWLLPNRAVRLTATLLTDPIEAAGRSDVA
jgi:hypothetical protein